MATYYLDSILGRDQNDGLAPERAWKTLDKANALPFAPGDSLLLKRGCAWSGTLKPQGTGCKDRRCTIDAYGAGPRPAIHGEGKVEAPIHLFNTEGWVVRGLELTNTGETRENHRSGILCEIADYGIAQGFTFEDNFIHDVNGSNVKAEGDTKGGIIVRSSSQNVPSRYNDVQIRHNHLVRCDRVGIYFTGSWRRDAWYPSLNVVIYGNLLEDIGGDGILNIATDGCIVERNRLLGARMRDQAYCAGIWPWSADNTQIRYNEAAYCKGTKDGQGFDCDYNCVGTTHEYNYSHDNDGGYILVCTAGQKNDMPVDIGCCATRIARNLSVNDLCRTFHIAGPAVGTRVEENCVYVGKDIDIPLFQYTGIHEAMGAPEQVTVSRNIFAARGAMRYVEAVDRIADGTFTWEEVPNPDYVLYNGNAYLGNHPGKPQDLGMPTPAPTMEELEAILLDENGQAKPGLETLDAFLDRMGWPKQ